MNGLLMKYFVLKPRGGNIYAKASRAALKAYADTVAGDNPELARDLKDWADKEQT